MNISLLDDFIYSLEDTFGKYKSGMQKVVRNKLSDMSQSSCDELLKHLTENYDMARPPSLKVILTEAYKYNIPLNTQKFYGISVCEFCGRDYSQDIIACPQCQRIRHYGITKLVRNKPYWYESKPDEHEQDYSQSIMDMFNAIVGIEYAMTDGDRQEYLAEREGKLIYDGNQDEATAVTGAERDLDRLEGRS